MPRIIRYDDFEDAGEQARQLRDALDAIAEGYDALATLDRRDRAMRELWAMGASKQALATFTGMSPSAVTGSSATHGLPAAAPAPTSQRCCWHSTRSSREA